MKSLIEYPWSGFIVTNGIGRLSHPRVQKAMGLMLTAVGVRLIPFLLTASGLAPVLPTNGQ